MDSIARPMLRHIVGASLLAVCASSQATNYSWTIGNYSFLPNPITMSDSVTADAGGDKNFSGISLVNDGAILWNPSERLGFVSSSLTNNNVVDLRGDANLTYVGGAASTFINNATFQKSVAFGTTTIGSGISFTNNGGIIRAAAGTIDFASGSATFNVGTQFTGAGVNRVSSSASFNGAFTSDNLVLTGGNFTGSGASIGGAVLWTGGQLVGNWTVGSGHTLHVQSDIDKNFSGVAFTNFGAVNWQTSERAGFVSSAVTNHGLFDLKNDANLTYAGGGASSFTNAATGIFRKSGGAGASVIGSGVSFINDGGVINAAAGTIEFAGGSATFNANTQFTGAGVNRVSNNASFNGAFTSANLVLSGGNFTGGSASISGPVEWTGGQFVGTWTLATGHTLYARTGSEKNFFGTTFVNDGTLNWQTANRVGFVSSAFVNNGTFNLEADANLTYIGGSASSFTNNLTFLKSAGTGTTTIGSSIGFVNNGGTIQADTGTIDFAGGSATFNAGTQFSGAGVNRVSNHASFNGAFTSANLVLDGGNYTGGAAVIGGTVTWTGGQFVGGWTLASGQTLNAQSGIDKNLSGTAFVNSGTLNWNTTDRIGFVSSSFTNNGIFDLKADANLTYIGGSASSFTNNAMFRKSAGAGTTTVGSAINFINNGGTIQADTGTINFAGGSATFNANTQFTGAGVNRLSNHASFNGAFTSANLVLEGGNFTGTAAAISGTVAWTGGQFVGSWTLAASQTLNAQSGSDKNFFGTTFVNNGRLNWNTAERVGFVSSSFVNNGTFDLKADANLSYAGGSASSFTNNGTLRKSDGTGSSTIGNAVNFSNPGTIEALSGTLVLPANFNNAGFIKGNATVQTTLLINAGHVAPGTSPGVLTLAGNFQQTSSGTLDIEIASTSVFDTLIVNGNAQLGGTLALQCIGACAIATGNSFVVLDATGDLTGTFATVTTSGFGAGFAYTLQYDTTNDLVRVNVTNAGIPPIPEPHTWALLIAGLGLVTTLARRRATRR
ncbi:MAG: PEP-CTERM sorting domain-containing protein [Burkholderiales bacterium]|nr:PEP-CTERM sorting domain-containing protein [Burkholderiales bacterium]